MFENMKVGSRLVLGIGIIIGFLVMISMVGLFSMKKTDTGIERIISGTSSIALVNKMIGDIREYQINIRDILLMRTSRNNEEIFRQIDELWKDYYDCFEQYETARAPNGTKVVGLISKIRVLQEDSNRIYEGLAVLVQSGRYGEAIERMNAELRSVNEQWIIRLNELIKVEKENGVVNYGQAKKQHIRAFIAMIVLGTVALVLGIVIAFFLTLSITRPLNFLTTMIMSRDLTTDFSAYKGKKNEFGLMIQSFSGMVLQMRNQMKEIQEGVNILTATSSEISAMTTQVAAGSAEYVAAINETTTTVEEVRQASQLSSQKATGVAESSQKLVHISQSGQKAVEETMAEIDRIRVQMELIAKTIVSMSEQSQNIGGIIASVTDIADQSNLLAVNAGIEAAKAGEQGRGFAVVAQEIRSLSEQSKQATAEVRKILNDVQKSTNLAVMVTEQGSKAVESGVKQAVQAGEVIKALTEATTEAVQVAMQIVASSQQQVVGMDQIGKAMENINQASFENAASVKQTEIAVRDINDLGQKLNQLVSQYKI